MVVGWLLYLPSAILVIGLAHTVYHMPLPARPVSLFVVVTLGIFAFRAIGMIIAAVANSMAESNILVQILYMPMLFLSGATIPVSSMPVAAQIISQFLPASYLNSGIQHVMIRSEGLATSLGSVGALLASTIVATWIARKLFRWEKGEKLPRSSKAWVAAVLAPFIALGSWQAWSRDHIDESKRLDREIRRNNTRLIRGPAIFTGDGGVIRNGGVLIRGGRIAEIYTDRIPAPEEVNADLIEAAGKTLLPGLIDVDVHLGGEARQAALRALAAYLYCGVTAVRAVGELPPAAAEVRDTVNSGVRLGAELFLASGNRQDEYYLGALSSSEASDDLLQRKTGLLSRSLVEQVAPPGLLAATRKSVTAAAAARPFAPTLTIATENLVRAWRSGLPLVTGAGSGNPMLIHGPATQRELQLWVMAGVPPEVALQAATGNAARLLGAAHRIGFIRKGYEATLILVDCNPLQDISVTERISLVLLKGEHVDTSDLFDQK